MNIVPERPFNLRNSNFVSTPLRLVNPRTPTATLSLSRKAFFAISEILSTFTERGHNETESTVNGGWMRSSVENLTEFLRYNTALKWFFELKWYVSFSIFIFIAFVFFQIESSIESNRLRRKKEGMANKQEEERMQTSDIQKKMEQIVYQIYNWWILPWYYVLVRSFGVDR